MSGVNIRDSMSSNQLLSHRSVFIIGILDVIIVATIVSFMIYKQQPGFGLLILFISCTTIPFLLYDVNCTYVGSCKIWGILKTIALVIQGIITIIILIIMWMNAGSFNIMNILSSPVMSMGGPFQPTVNF